MGTFIILALSVTLLFVCYYAIVIAVDLHGAHESGKPTVEEFSVSADKGEEHADKQAAEDAYEETEDETADEEGGVFVSESGDGFTLGTSILAEVDVSQLKQTDEPAQIEDEPVAPVAPPIVKPQAPQRPAFDIPIEGEEEDEGEEQEDDYDQETALQQHLAQIEAGLDDVHPAYEAQYEAEEFVRLMQNGETEQQAIRVRVYQGEPVERDVDKL